MKDNAAFVTSACLDVLGRNPDSAGFVNWVALLDGGADRATVMNAIVFSTEARTGPKAAMLIAADWEVLQVARAYDALPGRAADLPGLQIWRNALDQGLPADQLAQPFANSAEFDLIDAGRSYNAFVNAMYQNAFERSADPAGATAWLQALGTGTLTREQVALSFFGSPEGDAHLQDLALSGIDVLIG